MGSSTPGGVQRQYRLEIYSPSSDNQYNFNAYISKDGGSTNKVTVNSTTTTYASGDWHHVAMVYNDTDLRIYVDGALDSTPGAYTDGIYNGSAKFRIGLDGAGATNSFDGLIDEVAVFSRALSATEVSNIYTYGLTGNKGGSD